MNDLSSYCGLVDAKRTTSKKIYLYLKSALENNSYCITNYNCIQSTFTPKKIQVVQKWTKKNPTKMFRQVATDISIPCCKLCYF